MSDVPGGPNWFQGADGKWHAPIASQFEKKKRGKKLWIVLGVIVVIVIIAAAASGGKSKDKSTASGPTTTGVLSKQAASSSAAANDVSISKCSIDTELKEATATVAVTNHSSKTSNYIITVAFENPDGSQFDTGTALVQTLSPGQSGSDDAGSLKSDAPAGITCKITDVMRTAS